MKHGSFQNYKFPHGSRQKLQTQETFIAKNLAQLGGGDLYNVRGLRARLK